MARAWFAYDGTGNVDSVDSYLYAPTTGPSCFSGRTLCAIYATRDPSNPLKPLAISTNLQSYIGTGITNGGPQPPRPDKPYVYFLPINP